PRPLRGLRSTARAQQIDRSLHVAARLLQRPLALHHSSAGPLAQLLHLLRRDRHVPFPSLPVTPVRTVEPPFRPAPLHHENAPQGCRACSAAALFARSSDNEP